MLFRSDVEKGGGALSFYFSHVFYYLEYFIGKIKNLECNLSSSINNLNGGETVINMTILFNNGCMGNAHMDISSNNKQKHLVEFIGKEGSITLQNTSSDFVNNFELIVNTKEGYRKIQHNKILNTPNNESEDPRVKMIIPLAERFVSWCNNGIEAKPDFQDGLRVQELIDIARVSSQHRKYET